MLTLGDRSQAFQSLQNGARLKTDLTRFTQELSTGKPTDIASHLSGRTAELAGLDRDIARIDGFKDTSAALALTLDRQQISLGVISDRLERSAQRLVGLTVAASDLQISAAEGEGSDAFNAAIDELNAFSNGRALFSGVTTDRAPLASAETILTALEREVAGLTTAEEISRKVSDWFSDEVTGFFAVGYQGAEGPSAVQRISESQSIEATARADATELRAALAASATAALSGRLAGTVSRSDRADLLQTSGVMAFEAAQQVHSLAARVGDDQFLIETEGVRLDAQRTVYASARNGAATIDKFEAATRLQDVQQSLEVHFAATARLSRLSLANYL